MDSNPFVQCYDDTDEIFNDFRIDLMQRNITNTNLNSESQAMIFNQNIPSNELSFIDLTTSNLESELQQQEQLAMSLTQNLNNFAIPNNEMSFIDLTTDNNVNEPQHLTPEIFNVIFANDNSNNTFNSNSNIDLNHNNNSEDVFSNLITDLNLLEETESLKEIQNNVNSSCENLDDKTNTPLILDDVSSKLENKSNSDYYVKCENCNNVFQPEEFNNHICEYDKYKFKVDSYKINIFGDNERKFLKMIDASIERDQELLKDYFKVEKKDLAKRLNVPHECPMCERKFVHSSGLHRHMEKHSTDIIPMSNNNLTSIATTNFNMIPTLENNITLDKLNIVFKCILCGRIFFNYENYNRHINNVHQAYINGEEYDKCCNIPANKNEILDLIEKYSRISIGDPYIKFREIPCKSTIVTTVLVCEFCDYLSSNEMDLLKHTSLHDPSEGFQCSYCNINYSTFKDVFLHWQTDCLSKTEFNNKCPIPKLLVCNICQNKFQSQEQLYDHRYLTNHFFPRWSNKLQKLMTSCEYCGLVFDSSESHAVHHQEKHSKKLLKKEISTNRSRQYLCDVCGKSYTQSSHLWQHLRFHKGVKPFECKVEGCDRKFTIRPDLNDHVRKCHTGERPYHCVECGKRFLTGSVYYQHRLIHRGERRYGCNECGKRFYRADALKNHQRIHTGEKPYACSYCTKCFRQRGDRDKHIRARHSSLEANAKTSQPHLKNFDVINQQHQLQAVLVEQYGFPENMFRPVVSDIDEKHSV